MSKFYAVKVGLTPGVYNTWEECQNNTKGYPGAKFKSFATEEEALAFVNGMDVKKEVKEEIKKEDKPEGPIAYVDGSFDATTNRYSYGAVIFDGDKEIHLSGVGDDPEMASMRNVAGEIIGSQAAMEYALAAGMKEISIYHDYNGLAAWCIGGWKTNKEGTKAYKEKYLEVSQTVKINFVKVKGHSNVFYNDVVDALAKQALGITNGIKKDIAAHIEKIKELNK